jgi:hypothetical protein
MSRFASLISNLKGRGKDKIQTALDASEISDEDELRSIVRGRNIEQTTSLLQQPPLSLDLYDASALAGLLTPQVNYI